MAITVNLLGLRLYFDPEVLASRFLWGLLFKISQQHEIVQPRKNSRSSSRLSACTSYEQNGILFMTLLPDTQAYGNDKQIMLQF